MKLASEVSAWANYNIKHKALNDRGKDVFWIHVDRHIESFDYGNKERYRPKSSERINEENKTSSREPPYLQQGERSNPSATIPAPRYINAKY